MPQEGDNTEPVTPDEPQRPSQVDVALGSALKRLAGALRDGRPPVEEWQSLSTLMRLRLPKPSTVEEEDLSELWDAAENLPQPTMGVREDGKALLYAGKISWLAGEPGGGKSWVALYWMLEQVRDGQHVIMADFESDPVTIVARLRALGITKDELTFVHYVRLRLGADTLALTVERLVELLGQYQPSLVVLDGLATALAALGLDENSNSDVSRFTDAVLRPIADFGPAVLVIDHMSKPQQGATGGRYARGASAKLADASGCAFVLETAVAFSKSKPGIAKLRVGKDRNGAVGAAGEVVAEFHFTPTEEGLSISAEAPDPSQADGRWIPSALMSKVSSHLEMAGTATATELKELVGKKSWESYGSTVKALLEKHGYVKVAKHGNATVYTHVKRFLDTHADMVRDAEFGSGDGKAETKPVKGKDGGFW